MLQVEGEIDGQATAVRPAVVRTAAQGDVVVAAVVSQIHGRSVASEIVMGYGADRVNKLRAEPADALGGLRLTATSTAALPEAVESAIPRRLGAPLWVGALVILLAFLV